MRWRIPLWLRIAVAVLVAAALVAVVLAWAGMVLRAR